VWVAVRLVNRGGEECTARIEPGAVLEAAPEDGGAAIALVVAAGAPTPHTPPLPLVALLCPLSEDRGRPRLQRSMSVSNTLILVQTVLQQGRLTPRAARRRRRLHPPRRRRAPAPRALPGPAAR